MIGSAPLPTSRAGWITLLRDLGIRPSRGLGQNFLVEPAVVERIVSVAELDRALPVVEIGPGLGILTARLAASADDVTAIELDRDLARHLRRVFDSVPHVRVIEDDALRVALTDVSPADGDYDLVANLPYSAASAIIRRFLESDHPPRRMTVMVQREVAERIAAAPPQMSILGIATQVFAVASLAFDVEPENFLPPPTVVSTVVVLDRRAALPLPAEQLPRFFSLVNAGFRHRRKTVANSLTNELRFDKSQTAAVLSRTGIDPNRRAQTFTLEEWVALTMLWPSVLPQP